MVRKHDAWTKMMANRRRRRLKTPAPKNGWLLSELAQLTGLSETTVRYYVQQKLLRPIERRGTATRYDRRELLRLVAFLRLRVDGKLTLEEKKRNLDSMGDEAVERWLKEGPVPAAAAKALGFESAPTPGSTATPIAALQTGLAGVPSEGWQRITLLPGLELHVRADAKGAARLAAQRICEEYVVPAQVGG